MLHFFKNKYYRRVFLCYAFVILLLLFVFEASFISSGIRHEKALQRENTVHEAQILIQVVDDRFNMLNDTCQLLVGDTWIKKVSSQSSIVYESMDIFERRELCAMLRNYMNSSGIVSHMALLMPRKNHVIDTNALWDSTERYFASINLDENFAEKIYQNIPDSYGGLVLISLENSDDIVVVRSLDVLTELQQVFFYRISHAYFNRLLNQHLKTDSFCFEIVRNGESVFQVSKNAGTHTMEEILMPSTLFSWNYRICLPIADVLPYSVWFLMLLTILFILFGICLALLFSMFTYKPVMQILQRLNILDTSGDEFSAIRRRFEIIRESEIRMEDLSSQYYNAARNNMLVSMLHGVFAKRIDADAMSLFGIPFSGNKDGVYLVMIVAANEEQTEELRARDILNVQNYLILKKIPAVKCVTPESELILILYDVSDEGIEKLSRYVLLLSKYCKSLKGSYTCTSGLPHHGLLGISHSYQEAQEEKTDSETGTMGSYYFPLDWEIQMITQLRAGNYQTFERIIRELQRENTARAINTKQWSQLMTLIGELFQRVSCETGEEPKNLQYRISVLKENHDIAWDEILRIAQEMCLVTEDTDASQSAGIRIAQYLDTHYTDKGLSQKGVADEFHMSCPNLSKIFRRAVGKSFVDYLHELRVKAAKEAFDRGETDIIQVGQNCGYESEVTFRRAFFRIHAVTPYQYVQNLKKLI